MSNEEIKNKIIEVIAEQLGADAAQITPETRLREDLDMDSLDKVEFCIGLEKEFKVNIPDETLDKIATIQDAADTIEKLLPKESAFANGLTNPPHEPKGF